MSTLKKRTKKHNLKISRAIKHWHKIIGISKKTKEKIRRSLLGKNLGDKSPCWKPRNICESCKKIISRNAICCIICSGIRRRGKKAYNWNPFSSVREKLRFCTKYHLWRSRVFKRDNWTCQNCGKQKCFVEAHHKTPFAKLLKKYKIKTLKQAFQCKSLWSIDNGKTLCSNCHDATKGRPRGGRF